MAEMVIEILDKSSLGRVVALHERIHASLPDPRFLYRRDAAFFARIMAGGAIVGASDGHGELVAYAGLAAPGVRFPGSPTGFERLGLDPSWVALSAGGGVRSDHRGAGLMKRLLRARANHADALGARFVTAVVAPGNLASITALHGLGYAMVGIHNDDDGDNYLLLKPALARFAPPSAGTSAVPISNTAAHLSMLGPGRQVGLPAQRDGTACFAYVDTLPL